MKIEEENKEENSFLIVENNTPKQSKTDADKFIDAEMATPKKNKRDDESPLKSPHRITTESMRKK